MQQRTVVFQEKVKRFSLWPHNANSVTYILASNIGAQIQIEGRGVLRCDMLLWLTAEAKSLN